MAAAPVSRENSGPLEQAFQQTVISSQDDFLLDTAKSISTAEAPVRSSFTPQITQPVQKVAALGDQEPDSWLVQHDQEGPAGPVILMSHQDSRAESPPAQAPSTPTISRPRFAGPARAESIPGPQVLESQASADERSGSRIPKPSTHKRQLSDMSYSSGSASSSLTKSLLRQPGGMKGTPNQSNGTSGMIREPSTSSASMVRQPGDISGRRGSARQPSGANANGMVRQPSGTGRIARQPSGTSGQPSGTSGIARQPSGTTRIARQSSGTNGTGGMVRQPSGTGGAARLPNGTFGSGRQPSGMIGTGGMARQPSGTSGIPRQGSGANDMARQSSGRSNIPGAQNVAAARFTQPTQSSVARSTFSVAGSSHKRSAPPQATPESAEVQEALFSPLATPQPGAAMPPPPPPSTPPLLDRISGHSMGAHLEEPPPFTTPTDQTHGMDRTPDEAAAPFGGPFNNSAAQLGLQDPLQQLPQQQQVMSVYPLAGDVITNGPSHQQPGTHGDNGNMGYTSAHHTMGFPGLQHGQESGYPLDASEESAGLPPFQAEMNGPSREPANDTAPSWFQTPERLDPQLGAYSNSGTNFQMVQFASLQSETAFTQTPAAYLQSRAAFLASEAASLKTAEEAAHEAGMAADFPMQPEATWPATIPEVNPEAVPEAVPASIPNSIPAFMPNAIPAFTPEDIPHVVPADIHHEVSFKEPSGTAYRMEDGIGADSQPGYSIVQPPLSLPADAAMEHSEDSSQITASGLVDKHQDESDMGMDSSMAAAPAGAAVEHASILMEQPASTDPINQQVSIDRSPDANEQTAVNSAHPANQAAAIEHMATRPDQKGKRTGTSQKKQKKAGGKCCVVM